MAKSLETWDKERTKERKGLSMSIPRVDTGFAAIKGSCISGRDLRKLGEPVSGLIGGETWASRGEEERQLLSRAGGERFGGVRERALALASKKLTSVLRMGRSRAEGFSLSLGGSHRGETQLQGVWRNVGAVVHLLRKARITVSRLEKGL